MKVLFDTHCHFDTLDDARHQLVRAYEVGLRGINVIGTDVETSRQALDIIDLVEEERHTLGLNDLDIQSTVGLHPHEAQYYLQQRDQLENLLNNNIDRISGIGEAGYDLFYNHSVLEDQEKVFAFQINLAHTHKKPLVIHTRDAWEETFRTLNEYKWPARTILHCFTGGAQEAKYCVERGAYISISGIITFKNTQGIRDAIASVPLNSLLCETDAPWLAPVPFRGKNNEPSYLEYIVDQIVEIRSQHCGDDRETVEKALLENAYRAFR